MMNEGLNRQVGNVLHLKKHIIHLLDFMFRGRRVVYCKYLDLAFTFQPFLYSTEEQAILRTFELDFVCSRALTAVTVELASVWLTMAEGYHLLGNTAFDSSFE